MKGAGFAIGLVDGTDLASCRMYAGLAATWRGFSRNAYEALGSPAALAVMVMLNAALFVLPFVALPLAVVTEGAATGHRALGGGGGLAIALRAVLALRFGAPVWTALATPVAVALMIGIQLHSYVNARLGRRVTGAREPIWRGARRGKRSAPPVRIAE